MNTIEAFKKREVKAKDIFKIVEVSKKKAVEIVKEYHYLGEKSFMYQHAYGIEFEGEIMGVAVFGTVGGIVALKGWFGLDNKQEGFYELTRLAMNPMLNGTNATSFLLSHALKDMKKKGAKAIVSLADTSLHVGYIYQACNFEYFGLTDKKSDFIRFDGKLNPRGATKDVHGVWVDRTRKHRYCYLFDKSINVRYEKEEYPKGKTYELKCCGGTHKVFDSRFKETYTCPRCCDDFHLIE